MMSPLNPLESAFLGDLRAHRGRHTYLNDPVRFFQDVLGIEPWARQREILETVACEPRVAVRSGHKVSKSNSAAGLALWWVSTRPRGRVIMTSASARQVKVVLWKELRYLHARAAQLDPGKALGGEMNISPDAGLQFPDGREIVGFSTDEPDRMSGISGAYLLFILDEAAGIPEPVFQAIEGNRAGGAHIVMFSNPTQMAGTFYDAFHDKRDFWRPIHISAEESPNVTAGRVVIPGLATREWIDEKRREWGEDSPLYEVRVRGDFPSQAQNAIVALSWVEAAVERWKGEIEATGVLRIGVDVARYGDDETVIQPVRGYYAYPARPYRGRSVVETAGLALEAARQLRVPGERPVVQVDDIGVGGGVTDILMQTREIETVGVNVAQKAIDEENYHDLRSQVWFAVAEWLRDGGAIPDDRILEAELVAPTYSLDTRGRRVVEPKEKTKERLHRSPDRADALGLATFKASPRSFETVMAYTRMVIDRQRRPDKPRDPNAPLVPTLPGDPEITVEELRARGFTRPLR